MAGPLGHALCGPVAIRGAAPGMTLAIHIVPCHVYQLLASSRTNDNMTASITVVWKSASGADIRTDTIGKYASATPNWNNIGRWVAWNLTVAAPADAASATMRISVTRLFGTLWVDEFSITDTTSAQ